MFVFTALCTVLLVAIKEASTASYITSCPNKDKACVESVTNSVYQQLMKGIPELGIAPNEPALLAEVDADLAGLRYIFTNAKLSGFDKCKVGNFRNNAATLKMQFQLSCPKIVLEAPYEASGSILMTPVHGKGLAILTTGLYTLDYECSAKLFDNNGMKYLSIRSCRVNADAVEPIDFDVEGLFDGNKQMSDVFHDLLHTSWKPVHEIIKDPIWEVHTKNCIIATNKLLRNVPAEVMLEGW